MKKIIISISCIILALTMCIGFVSCAKKDEKPKDKVVDITTTQSAGDNNTPEDSNNTDEQTTNKKNESPAGNDTATTKKGDTSSKKDDKKPSEKKDDKTTKKDSNQTTKKAKETTKKKKPASTTTTLHYTTTNLSGVIVTPEESLDDEYILTGSLAMYNLQQKYDPEKYVVNLIDETMDSATLYVFVLKDNSIHSTAKVNLKNGNTTETNKKTGKKTTYNLA